jgi:DNA adenine methylase
MESNMTTPTQNDMKVTAIAPWFGSKRTMAPIIVAELGPHRAYFEPFCGGMSVLLNKPPCGHETINDLHSDLINLARVIQDVKLGSQLYRRLRRVVLHEEVLEEAWESLALMDRPQRVCGYFQRRRHQGYRRALDARRGAWGSTACGGGGFASSISPENPQGDDPQPGRLRHHRQN